MNTMDINISYDRMSYAHEITYTICVNDDVNGQAIIKGIHSIAKVLKALYPNVKACGVSINNHICKVPYSPQAMTTAPAHWYAQPFRVEAVITIGVMQGMHSESSLKELLNEFTPTILAFMPGKISLRYISQGD